MKYEREAILEGNKTQKRLQETPSTFHAANQLDRPATRTRMAGEQGARAIELMSNPEAQKQAQNWMQLFGQSNQGMQFNQAKMIQAQPPAPQPEGQDEQN